MNFCRKQNLLNTGADLTIGEGIHSFRNLCPDSPPSLALICPKTAQVEEPARRQDRMFTDWHCEPGVEAAAMVFGNSGHSR